RVATEEAARPAPEPPPTAPGHVLVVDDEPAVAALMREALEQDGHRVEVVHDGAAALERVARAEFDLVLADLRMPGLGGARLIEELAQLRPELAKHVLLTTGDTLGSEAARLEAHGAGELLHKPFDVEQLRRRVRALLAGERSG
ncbi:MAG TPA: response regulator, partial [Candidatus Polarisedimenticolaceae bacterium]|nr:response regulator [Candidatus Polarisedimenticolaceae bacterium]